MTLPRLLPFLVAFALLPAVAQAHTTIIAPPESHLPYQQWVDEARVPTPGGSVTVVEDTAACTDQPVLGCTDGTTIWMQWIGGRATFDHELGHIFAFQHPGLADFYSERFAQSYSLCARLDHIDPRWQYWLPEGGAIRGRRLRAICDGIRAAPGG